MLRRTKIVATLGPACDDPSVLEKMIVAGVDVVRLNFSHGQPEDHINRANTVREFASKHKRTVAILGDLQGPKIRIARFKDKSICLAVGDTFALDSAMDSNAGDQNAVGIDYKELPDDCEVGDMLLLDDGRVIFKVTGIEGTRIDCVVTVGGALSNNKGINRQGGGLSAPALTDKDMRDIKTAAEIGVDFLAVSFPRSADDITTARKLANEAGSQAAIVAKIERAETVDDLSILDEIIEASDGVMVARGDLGVEIGDAELIGVQKEIIQRTKAQGKVVITATQMMESMISSPLPTRAEVFDVANAVLDGTDAVMLSGETAAGDFPVETIEAMCRVILGAERHYGSTSSNTLPKVDIEEIDEAIAHAVMYAANQLKGVKAIICMTETGSTPRLMSRISSNLPIFAFTQHLATQARVALCRGVHPVGFEVGDLPPEKINASTVNQLVIQGVVNRGDLVLISKGDYVNVHGGTNTLKIVKVGDDIH